MRAAGDLHGGALEARLRAPGGMQSAHALPDRRAHPTRHRVVLRRVLPLAGDLPLRARRLLHLPDVRQRRERHALARGAGRVLVRQLLPARRGDRRRPLHPRRDPVPWRRRGGRLPGWHLGHPHASTSAAPAVGQRWGGHGRGSRGRRRCGGPGRRRRRHVRRRRRHVVAGCGRHGGRSGRHPADAARAANAARSELPRRDAADERIVRAWNALPVLRLLVRHASRVPHGPLGALRRGGGYLPSIGRLPGRRAESANRRQRRVRSWRTPRQVTRLPLSTQQRLLRLSALLDRHLEPSLDSPRARERRLLPDQTARGGDRV